jgi:hypothetical protein
MTISYTPHTIRIRIADAEHVALVGDFNNWHTAAHPLVQVGGDVWERIVDLPAGKHKYAFFVLGRGEAGQTRSRIVANGSVLFVPEPGDVDIRITAHPAKLVQSAA